MKSKKRKLSFKSRILDTDLAVRFFSFLLYWLIKALTKSSRISYNISEESDRALRSGKPLLIAFWHDALIFAAHLTELYPERQFTILISSSRDGHIPSRFAERLPNVSIIRVVADSRSSALKKSIEALSANKVVAFTPDGPRGPRHEVKPGIIFSAQESEAAVIAVGWTAHSSWTLSTWDRFRIPKPFTKVTFSISRLHYFSKEMTVEEASYRLKNALMNVAAESCS